MQLEPYIFFYGRCEEALTFYKQAIGGAYELTRNDDSGVMHATYTGPRFAFMASDGDSKKTIDPRPVTYRSRFRPKMQAKALAPSRTLRQAGL